MDESFPHNPPKVDSQILDSGLGRLDEVTYEELVPHQAEEILKDTEIHGASFHGKNLTVDDLRAQGLEPVLRIQFGDGAQWSASRIYDLNEGGYRAIVAYVHENDQKTIARSFYLSRSQLVWRYLPQYLEINGELQWFSKWVSEYAITGPFAVQQVLANAQRQGVIKPSKPMEVFAGTARPIGRDQGTLVNVVDSSPELLEPTEQGYYRSHGAMERRSPETVGALPFEKRPDFAQESLAAWETSNELYGDVQCEVFPSQDGTLRYLFCRDSLGRAWIASIENDSPVKTVGVRQHWVDGGDLVTPAWEHESMRGGYQNYKFAKKGYVDMFENYLVHVPMIRQYLEHVVARGRDAATQEKIAKHLVTSATSFEQLFDVLKSIPEENEQNLFWQPAIAAINLLRIGQADYPNITSRFGLRRKVFELMVKEKHRGRGIETNNG
jgi:hypothetical protein